MLVTVGTQVPEFTYASPWEKNLSFHAALAGTPTALYFLRYLGCPLCQLKISELRADAARFSALGARVFVVLQSEPAVVQPLLGRDFPLAIICDPRQDVFRQYGVAPGNLLQYIAPSVILKALEAKRKGFRHGVKEGNERQRPAVFLIDAARTIRFVHYGSTIGDVPANDVILSQLSVIVAAGA